MLHISIENIDKQVIHLSTAGIGIGEQLKADFANNTVKAVEAYFPATAPIVEGAKAIVDTAIGALKALHDLADDEGFKGRLLTLSASLVALETSGKHEWSDIIYWVQTVFNHIKKG